MPIYDAVNTIVLWEISLDNDAHEKYMHKSDIGISKQWIVMVSPVVVVSWVVLVLGQVAKMNSNWFSKICQKVTWPNTKLVVCPAKVVTVKV